MKLWIGIVSIALTLAPGSNDRKWAYERSADPSRDGLPENSSSTDKWIHFGEELVGNLKLPSDRHSGGVPTVPIIVLAHGLGLSQDCSLDPFVRAFNDAGFATFTFDYATFGASGSRNLPKHVVDPESHVADVRAALTAMHECGSSCGINVERMALWGTSLGGGHVLAAAAASDTVVVVQAIVAQVPHLASGLEATMDTLVSNPIVFLPALVKVLAAVAKGALAGLLGLGPWYIPLHGLPGDAAIMTNPGDDEGYGSLCSGSDNKYNWRNAVTTGSVLRILKYRPMQRALSLSSTPVLFVAAENDTLCPAKWVEHASSLMENARLLLLPGIGHFDVYSGEPLRKILKHQVYFFKKHLAGS